MLVIGPSKPIRIENFCSVASQVLHFDWRRKTRVYWCSMSKIHTNHSGVAFESVSVRLWCDYLNGTSTEVSALKNLIFQCSVLGKKIKDWQQDICEKCQYRRYFTVSSRVRCTCFAETNQTWNYFLTWSFRGNATFTWKDWRRKENEADWRWHTTLLRSAVPTWRFLSLLQ